MEIKGSFISKDRDTSDPADGRFVILKDGMFIKCTGPIPKLKKMIPIVLTGDYAQNGLFAVSDMRIDTGNRRALVSFLSNHHYKKVGKATAEKVYDQLKDKAMSLHKDIDTLTSQEMSEALDGLKIPSEEIPKMTADLTSLHIMMELSEALKPYGGTYKDADAAYRMYGNNAIQRLTESPYGCANEGMGLGLCDSISKASGRTGYNVERAKVMLCLMRKKILSTGSTCSDINTCLNYLEHIQDTGVFPPLKQGFLSMALVSDSQLEAYRDENGKALLSPKSAYRRETLIAQELYRLCQDAKETGWTEYQGETGLDDDQLKVLDFLKTTGIKIMCGGPGAGKTTTIKALVSEYEKLGKKGVIKICAPTGRAAQRVEEATGYSATTIHKLLGYVPAENDDDFERIEFDRNNPLPKGLYIVDEMSMVGEDLFLKLLFALQNGSILILSGDTRQLKSVDPGKVLEDLIESGVMETVILNGCHRQDEGNSIITNYQKIKDGKTDLVLDNNFYAFTVNSYATAINVMEQAYKAYYKEEDPFSAQILTFMKKGSIGKYELNRRIAGQRNVPQEKYYGRSNYAIGDKIMMTRNNYDGGYMNGDVGRITAITKDGLKIRFYDGERLISGKNLPDMEHAWASTVHKAQGSEYDAVIILVDDSVECMLYNAIILTAVTRAKKKCVLIEMNNGARKAIVNIKATQRHTGLSRILKEVFSS